MKLFATGRDPPAIAAPGCGRLNGRFRDQCPFSPFTDAQNATIPRLQKFLQAARYSRDQPAAQQQPLAGEPTPRCSPPC